MSGIGRNQVPIFPKKMGLGCSNCRFKCLSKISINQRHHLFQQFWHLKEYERQSDYILLHMTVSEPTERNENFSERRKVSHKFTLEDGCGLKVRVRRQTFLETLDKNIKYIQTLYLV